MLIFTTFQKHLHSAMTYRPEWWLVFTPVITNLLISLPILSEGGGHNHCNFIIKLLTLALYMGLLVAHWRCIGICLKVSIAKICLLWINIWVNFGSYSMSGFVCSLVRNFIWNIWEELNLNAEVFNETEIHVSYTAKGWKQSQSWQVTAEQTSVWNIKYFFALWLSR